ncbi:MAG: hypothetical protein HYZ23_10300, partial [Chloroflexi bacterium]|nr:hypothetical protein [Chloroflexota bacterium]
PTLLPPVTHLEIWAGNDLQYSSFTTQLFWVFNQAVPAWLCILLIMNEFVIAKRWSSRASELPARIETRPIEQPIHREIASGIVQERPRNDEKVFIWALSFFFAPLVSIGLFPYLIVEIFSQTGFSELRDDSGARTSIRDWLDFKSLRLDILFAAAIVFLLSYFFFSSNTAAQERGLQAIAIKDWIPFFLIDGGIFWLLLAKTKWRDPRWALTGILLLAMPFIQFGNGRDFVMRASIAPLFYLMVMVTERILHKNTPRFLLITVCLLLLLGSLTPLYEINRSVTRTYEYYFVLDESQRAQPNVEPATRLEKGIAPEKEHPNAILADDVYTLRFMKDKLSKNFIANVRQSFYYRYLSPR